MRGFIMLQVRVRTGDNPKKVLDKLSHYISLEAGSVIVRVPNDVFYEDGTPVAAVALWNEYGTKKQFPGDAGAYHVPPRPFLRNTVRRYAKNWSRSFAYHMRNGKTAAEAAQIVGALMVKHVQLTIGAGVPPPNAPATVAAKGGSETLIDQGVLISSIVWEWRGMRGRMLERQHSAI